MRKIYLTIIRVYERYSCRPARQPLPRREDYPILWAQMRQSVERAVPDYPDHKVDRLLPILVEEVLRRRKNYSITL